MAVIFLTITATSVLNAGKKTLTITSDPSGAQVEINGRFAGVTPYVQEVDENYFKGGGRFVWSKYLGEPGIVTISKEGFVAKTITITNGPFRWVSLNGQNQKVYYVITSPQFHIKLDPLGIQTIAKSTGTESPAVPPPVMAQSPGNYETAVANQAVPSEFAIDFQLALSGRSKAMGGSPALLDPDLNLLGKHVFDDLHGSPVISSLGLPYQWNLTMVDNQAINASSTAGGQIYVDGGMARLLGRNSGLWAAVLSHEVSHTALRHHVRLYLAELNIAVQIRELRLKVAKGDQTASWTLAGLQIAAPIALRKLSRDQEHQADIHGMVLMARAGYHPDFVFALHHMLRMKTGDQSKFAAFFSTHPRWETRDQRSDKAYSDALAEFNRLWADPQSTPGGRPPVVAFLGDLHASENKQSKTADITLSLYCRNAANPVIVAVLFSHEHTPVPAADGPYRNSNGNLEAQELVQCFDKDDAAPAVIRVPASAVVAKNRKLKAEVLIVDPEGNVLERSKFFDVHFPKP